MIMQMRFVCVGRHNKAKVSSSQLFYRLITNTIPIKIIDIEYLPKNSNIYSLFDLLFMC